MQGWVSGQPVPLSRRAVREEGGDEALRRSRCRMVDMHPPTPLANSTRTACSSADAVSLARRKWRSRYDPRDVL